MKHLLLILICANLSAQQLIKIEPDSISSTIDVVDKAAYFNVFKDGVIYSQHTKKQKANAVSLELKLNNPNSEIYVTSPNSEPTAKIDVYIDKSKLTPNLPTIIITQPSNEKQVFELPDPLPDTALGNECGGNRLEVVSDDFDFKDIPVILLNARWTIKGNLYNNGQEITLTEAFAKELIQMECMNDSRVRYNTGIKIGGAIPFNLELIPNYESSEGKYIESDGVYEFYADNVGWNRVAIVISGLDATKTYTVKADVKTVGTGFIINNPGINLGNTSGDWETKSTGQFTGVTEIILRVYPANGDNGNVNDRFYVKNIVVE